MEVYDPQADSWQQVASMPQGLFLHAAAAMGGKIYVTGGLHQGDSVSSVCVYDPQADAWTQPASMSIAMDGHASTAVGGKIYVFGGYGARGRHSAIYDPASDSWAQGSSLTSARCVPAVIAL